MNTGLARCGRRGVDGVAASRTRFVLGCTVVVRAQLRAWVEEQRIGDFAPGVESEQPKDSERRYDVVDRQGASRGVIHTPPDQTIVGSGRSSLYVVQKDDLDLSTLSRHYWPNQLTGSAADAW